MRELTCAEVGDCAAGFALDILEADRRSQVAAHMLRCRSCREHVARTQASAERLLDVGSGGYAPPEPVWVEGTDEPSWADGDSPIVRPGRRRLRAAVTMAAVVVLVVGTTLGPEIEQAARPGATPSETAALAAGSATVGSVRIYPGSPPVIQIEVTGLPGGGTVRADLLDAAGRVAQIGELRLVHGRADWAATEPRGMNRPSEVLLVGSRGQVLATADFS